MITLKVSDIFGVLCMHLATGPLSRCRARGGSREGPGEDDPQTAMFPMTKNIVNTHEKDSYSPQSPVLDYGPQSSAFDPPLVEPRSFLVLPLGKSIRNVRFLLPR